MKNHISLGKNYFSWGNKSSFFPHNYAINVQYQENTLSTYPFTYHTLNQPKTLISVRNRSEGPRADSGQVAKG